MMAPRRRPGRGGAGCSGCAGAEWGVEEKLQQDRNLPGRRRRNARENPFHNPEEQGREPLLRPRCDIPVSERRRRGRGQRELGTRGFPRGCTRSACGAPRAGEVRASECLHQQRS